MAIELGLSPAEAIVLDYLIKAQAWAEPLHIDEVTHYWVSKEKVAADLCILSKDPLNPKSDTFYRFMKRLAKAGLISLVRQHPRDYVRVEPSIARQWVESKTRMAIRVFSDGHPTDNNIDIDTINSVLGEFNRILNLPKGYSAKNRAYREAISARMAEGATASEMVQVIRHRWEVWAGTEMEKYFTPETIFRPSKYPKYWAAAQKSRRPASMGATVAPEIKDNRNG